MSTRKDRDDTSSSSPSTTPIQSTATFPFARYTSIVGVHTSLLAFSALILPATSPSFGLSLERDPAAPASPKSGRDILQTLSENPVRTVALMCAGAAVLQWWWASWIREWSIELRKEKKDSAELTREKLERRERKNEQLVVLGQAAAMTISASVLFHFATVLFGAPISSHFLHTYTMSLLLAILTILPPAYTLGIPSFASGSPALISRLTWIRLFAELSPRTPLERALVYPGIGALLGCWAGAIPIGLDWERPWQAWPLTPTFGAIGGYIVGSLAALVISATFELAQADHQQEAQRQAQTAKKSKKTS